MEMGYIQPQQTFQSCTNCYSHTINWHLYKNYYWCDGCDYKQLYSLFIKRKQIKVKHESNSD